MDSKTMTINGASDAEIRQWLVEVCPMVARALELPRPMQKAADQFFKVVPVDTALRWVEMLGMGKADDIRLTVENTPNAATILDSQEGLQAIRDWETTNRVVPVLKALGEAADTVPISWSKAGSRPRPIIRSLAAIGVSHLVPGSEGFREELAAISGGSSNDTAALIESFASAAVVDDTDKITRIDRLISGRFPFGSWVRSLWVQLKLKLKAARRGLPDDLKSHPLWRLSLTLREIAGAKNT